jgi:cell division protein FtsW
MIEMSERKPTVDYFLITAILSLVAIGIIIVYSASTVKASVQFNDPNYFFKRHIVHVILGLLFLWIFIRIDYHNFQKLAKWGFLAAVVLMGVMLFVKSNAVRGSVRKFDIGPISFQPCEVLKFALILYVADALTRKQDKFDSFMYGFLPLLLIVGVAGGLILLQPDFDHAVIVACIGFVMFFYGGVKLRYLLGTGVVLLPVAVCGLYAEPNRVKRLIEFFNPSTEMLSTNYQTFQSLISLGSGGFFGVGIGQSKEKMLFLPEPFTDFIFSILGEEAGFIGAMLVLVLFFLILWRGLVISRRAPDAFGSLLAAGITFSLIIMAFINIGMASGLLPAIGLPLPFLSYGGSSLLITLAASGILLNIGMAKPVKVLGAVSESHISLQSPYVIPFRRKAKIIAHI